MNKKNKKLSKYRYCAMVGSMNSHLQVLLEKQIIQRDKFNTYQSKKDKLFARIIIPEIQESGFKLQIHISIYYQKLYPFRNAVFFFSKYDLDTYQLDLRQKPLNPIKLFKLCILLQFEQMLIVLETDDQIEKFKIIQKELEYQIKIASNQNKIVTNFSYSTNERFSFDLIQKNSINPDSETKYLETNFIVTNVIDDLNAEVAVFYGALFKGQKLYIDKEAIIVQKIISFNQDIQVALEGMIVQITFDKKIQLQEGSVGCYTQILLADIEIEVFSQLPLQDKPLMCSDIYYQLYNWKKPVTIEKKQSNQSITQQFAVKRQLLSFSRWPNIIGFSNFNSQIQVLGIIRSIPKVALQPGLLIPTYGFEQQFIEENESLRKFICRCRSCKMSMIDTVMVPCGHVRYCSGCAYIMRECYYCDKKSYFNGVIQIKECNPNLHRLLIQGTLEEEFVDHTNFQVLPKLVQFEIEQQIQSPNLYFKCVKCFKELISHILVDKNLKYQYVCNYCANQANRLEWNIVKIQYQCV
ncbi:unnamed protein product [Paramecium primaurelia]|uniref:RING-type domain-containing protein n=1 Tax=Paramecium primaurelia TaxID=5886 RepID=A0A8S1LQU3_PARPR|nr:unnamed protein product [Paramecium primaurelia]